jgi:methylenetetrahydrofolate dehydrogenase (NADP+)/methenyltetrahydrofolate cyclohydrolase
MVVIIDGNEVAGKIEAEIKEGVDRLKEKGYTPGLATILVGENDASKSYVRMKRRACKRLGINKVGDGSKPLRLPAETTQDELVARINEFNERDDVHGILVQLPLPPHISEFDIMDAVDPRKDVDGFSAETIADICRGDEVYLPPCTPYGAIELLKHYDIGIQGKDVVIVGRSNIVGTPLANLLRRKEYSATVTVCHSRTKDLPSQTRRADILVAAIGRPDYVTPDMVKEGAVVIDVGSNKVEDASQKNGYRWCGDVDFDAVKDKCSYITPSPGGVGPMTIAILMQNTYKSALRFYGVE